MDRQPANAPTGTTRTVWRHVLLVLGMFGFCWALVPLYDVICDITGLNGKTGGPYAGDAAMAGPDTSREVTVRFRTTTNAGMPWEFRAVTKSVTVHPGEPVVVNFYVKNPTDRPIVGQAIPSLLPIAATDYFHKTECFCFEEQLLQPGEEMEMPMRFIVDRDLPSRTESLALSYTLYEKTDAVAAVPAARAGGVGR